ncbi:MULTISPECIES: ABC transporter substrate-binding protein [unclassified Pseudomonas]|uniref:ABC transporter substrate-binding protein n=1 Tax=unclassified Pseudomonas TaxID=196821 RepID=UPI00215CAACD|nr:MULTISPECIES: ABC transporter substrate-binding protein [unclassified Pseudomonas]MCR8932238.1 ABC transporter substrate-binding protein [Pseudomonas sp. S11A4]MCR8975845.1 ABC transporter substrate-binding protein [Pseudomonas sp. S11P7]
MKKIKAMMLFGVASALVSTVQARDLTVISFGGAVKDAQNAAYVIPYINKTRDKVIFSEYNGELSKIRAMVDTRSVNWDVVEVEDTDAALGCDQGLFEQIDYSKIGPKQDFIAGAAQPCGVGAHAWSTVLAYNADRLTSPPTSWADFWDVKKYPGKRALRRTARGSLEFALMADGVAPSDVYSTLSTKQGVDRAFRKLDQIKPFIQWWDSGAQPAQFLVSGDVVMSSAYSGRISAARASGVNLANIWNQNLYQMDLWMIPKGTVNLEAAYSFIKFASLPQNQIVFVNHIAYGPTTKAAFAGLPPETLAILPSSEGNLKNALKIDVDFWSDNGESLEQRFVSWASK